MSSPAGIVILDADGVFLAERPYWNAALGTALDAAGLATSVGDRWDPLADVAFDVVGVQRVTKSVGCNSNWDLAAVLFRALEDQAWGKAVAEFVTAPGREREAMTALRAAAVRLRTTGGNSGDPLQRFGIERDSSFYRGVVDHFQRVLHGTAVPEWAFERWQLKETPVETAAALGAIQDAGFELRVCTGRHRTEIERPIRELGIEPYLPFSGITAADEVDRAEAESGRAALGKPHWFAPACAAVGYVEAIRALSTDGALAGSAVYLGDAMADFEAVLGCRRRGLDLSYVHVRSGVTTGEQERDIAEDEATLGVVSSLAEAAAMVHGTKR